MATIFDPIKLGDIELKNRIIMAPLTRCRADAGRVPNALMAEYYVQRASAGLILSEATSVTPMGVGYPDTPGIWSNDQVRGWSNVTKAIHGAGGKIFLQLWHVGRISHPSYLNGETPVAPSAIQPKGHVSLVRPLADYPTPRALETAEIADIVEAYRVGAENAKAAGFDGVEIHGANGYLVHQFFAPNANTRSDQYGGDIANRVRFALEVAAAVADEIGADRTAIRLSPGSTAGGIAEGEQGPDLYRHLVAGLDRLNLAYLHLMDQGDEALLRDLRAAWHGTLVLNRPGRPRENIGADVASGLADVEAHGQLVLANPDFIARLQANAPMNAPQHATYYGGAEAGYTDYPALA